MHLPRSPPQIIPLDERGQLGEAFNVRLEELRVVDLALLHPAQGRAGAGQGAGWRLARWLAALAAAVHTTPAWRAHFPDPASACRAVCGLGGDAASAGARKAPAGPGGCMGVHA